MKLDDAAYMRCASRAYLHIYIWRVFVNVARYADGALKRSFSPDVDDRV